MRIHASACGAHAGASRARTETARRASRSRWASARTAISDDRLPTFALSAEVFQASLEKGTFQGCNGPEEATLRMESWSYDPLLLASADRVDALSLHRSLRESLDERIQQQLAELIDQVAW